VAIDLHDHPVHLAVAPGERDRGLGYPEVEVVLGGRQQLIVACELDRSRLVGYLEDEVAVIDADRHGDAFGELVSAGIRSQDLRIDRDPQRRDGDADDPAEPFRLVPEGRGVPEGSVVIGANTYDRIRAQAVVRALGAPELKGKSKMVEAYELIGLRESVEGGPGRR
jgi:hypothetical protein